jgi:tetratricopeptide (TPR) repeat protein
MRVLALLLAFALALVASTASAEDDPKKAAKAFHEGQRAYAAGDFRHAAQSFEEAYQAKPHHDALWNAARSWQKAGEPARAANDYTRYLDIAPANAIDRDNATSALNDLGPTLGRVEVHTVGTTNVRFDGATTGTGVVYVSPGEHVAEADSDDGPVRKVFTVDAGKSISVTLAPAPKETTTTPPPPPPDDRAKLPPPPQRKPLSPVIVYVGGGLTVVCAGLATWQGLDTVSKKNDFQSAPPAQQTQAKLDDARGAELRTNIAIAGAVGFGLLTGAAALFLVDWKGDAKTTVGIAPFGVSVARRF